MLDLERRLKEQGDFIRENQARLAQLRSQETSDGSHQVYLQELARLEEANAALCRAERTLTLALADRWEAQYVAHRSEDHDPPRHLDIPVRLWVEFFALHTKIEDPVRARQYRQFVRLSALAFGHKKFPGPRTFLSIYKDGFNRCRWYFPEIALAFWSDLYPKIGTIDWNDSRGGLQVTKDLVPTDDLHLANNATDWMMSENWTPDADQVGPFLAAFRGEKAAEKVADILATGYVIEVTHEAKKRTRKRSRHAGGGSTTKGSPYSVGNNTQRKPSRERSQPTHRGGSVDRRSAYAAEQRR